jgi:hypothetical protein
MGIETLSRDEMHRAFKLWRAGYYANPESFLSEDETRSAWEDDADRVADEDVAFLIALARGEVSK